MCYETSLQESFPYIFKNPAYSSGYNDVSCLYIARYFIFARIGLWDSISSCVGMIITLIAIAKLMNKKIFHLKSQEAISNFL